MAHTELIEADVSQQRCRLHNWYIWVEPIASDSLSSTTNIVPDMKRFNE